MSEAKKIYLLENRLGYVFIDKSLRDQALTHRSARHVHNERLEFLGDAALNCIIAAILYHHFPQATEGQLTRARASLVNRTALSEVARELSLEHYIEVGLGEKRSGGLQRDSILADAVEALLGAIYLDGGMEACHRAVQQCYASRVAMLSLQEQKKDPKTDLQEWLQARHHALPKYTVTAILGESPDQKFTVSCAVESYSRIAEGTGLSRRQAEQEAARKMLEQLK